MTQLTDKVLFEVKPWLMKLWGRCSHARGSEGLPPAWIPRCHLVRKLQNLVCSTAGYYSRIYACPSFHINSTLFCFSTFGIPPLQGWFTTFVFCYLCHPPESVAMFWNGQEQCWQCVHVAQARFRRLRFGFQFCLQTELSPHVGVVILACVGVFAPSTC